MHVTYKVKTNLVTLYPGGAKVKIYNISMFTARIKPLLLSKYVVIFLLCSLPINFVKIQNYNFCAEYRLTVTVCILPLSLLYTTKVA
jgi:hypothetical protein